MKIAEVTTILRELLPALPQAEQAAALGTGEVELLRQLRLAVLSLDKRLDNLECARLVPNG